MSENKNIPEIELNDEALDEASGGLVLQYKCGGGCNRQYYGRVPFYVGNTPYCANCYAKYRENNKPYERRG